MKKPDPENLIAAAFTILAAVIAFWIAANLS